MYQKQHAEACGPRRPQRFCAGRPGVILTFTGFFRISWMNGSVRHGSLGTRDEMGTGYSGVHEFYVRFSATSTPNGISALQIIVSFKFVGPNPVSFMHLVYD